MTNLLSPLLFFSFFAVCADLKILDSLSYFTGHTKDSTGRSEFVAGKTSASNAVDGAIKIVTVAVSATYLSASQCMSCVLRGIFVFECMTNN